MARELGEPASGLQVTLVEATRRLLNGFSTRSSRAALADLRRRGVDVRLGQTVQAAPAAPARSCWNNPRDATLRSPWPISCCSCDTRCNERPWHSPADDRFLAVGSGKQ